MKSLLPFPRRQATIAVAALCATFTFQATALAFNGHEVKSDGLLVRIEEFGPITAIDQATPVVVTLENLGAGLVRGTAELRDLVDETQVPGATKQDFTIEPKQKTTVKFSLLMGRGALSALYPAHVYVNFQRAQMAQEPIHAVRIFETKFAKSDTAPGKAPEFAVNVVPRQGSLLLWTLGTHRMAWQNFGRELQHSAAGFTGSDKATGADLRVETLARGETKRALAMHPAWRGGAGTVFCEYQLKLPEAKPLRVKFANAIRDTAPQEPASDGVLFRVWVAPIDATTGRAAADEKLLYEKFTDSKTWLPGEANLEEFAGQTVLLRLESHPGPKNNTTCDGSFWGEPVVVAGRQTPPLTAEQFAACAQENEAHGRAILAGSVKPDGQSTFLIGREGQRYAAVLKPTATGIVDGVITLVGPKSAVSYQGLRIDLLNQPAVRQPSPYGFVSYQVRVENGRAVHTHTLEKDGQQVAVTVTVSTEGDGLRMAIASDARITDFALGPADRAAPAVYFGHGYRVQNPEAFSLHFGGHALSTSHIGVDYAGGMSVLQAVDIPPDRIQVNPQSHDYTLHSHTNGTLTLVASEQGAFDCALRYRPLYDKKPSGGVANLAGRYCFDIWGGKYQDIVDRMRTAIRYGLTDSILTLHVWQRWGYDYRLPDIWPPDPQLGTVADLKTVGDICRAQGIPWGLHDNRIDFYPDAAGYTYNQIAFTPKGEPIKAWLNEGRQAQSYRFRPDCITPYVQRNLKLIKEGVAPSHYFIDVFTSIELFDFYDRQGNFHPSTETRQQWGDAFAWIQGYLGNNAATTSEAGDDQLIGWLDGADCQHLTISKDGAEFNLRVPCADWERVPWFDVVNHDRFILHGVGYSGRYEGGRGRTAHGINSDDYISAEMLTGHALMTDAGSWGRPAVRKYWLAQDVARSLALKNVTNVALAGGDMHRQTTTWNNGVQVVVNRGTTDWQIAGATLPQYGYRVTGPNGLLSTIEKRDGIICESSHGTGGWYCNARAFEPNLPLRIAAKLENFEYLGGNQIKYDIVWNAKEPAPRPVTVFGHFYDAGEKARTLRNIAFQDDYQPTPPPTEWRGENRSTRTVTVPEQADGKYYIGYGLFDRASRLNLTGLPVPKVRQNELWAGTLNIKRTGDKITKIEFLPPPAAPASEDVERVNSEKKPIDFGFARTNGALRIQKTDRGLRVVPLPDTPAFEVTLRLESLLGPTGKTATIARAVNLSPAGEAAGELKFTQQGGDVTFRHDGTSFGYDLIVK